MYSSNLQKPDDCSNVGWGGLSWRVEPIFFFFDPLDIFSKKKKCGGDGGINKIGFHKKKKKKKRKHKNISECQVELKLKMEISRPISISWELLTAKLHPTVLL